MNVPKESSTVQRHAGDSRSPHSKPRAPAPSTYMSASKSLRHVSPRNFHQIQQQQRATALRAMPLSPLSAQVEGDLRLPPKKQELDINNSAGDTNIKESRDPVPWNPAWLPEVSIGQANSKAVEALLRAAEAMGAAPSTKFGTMTLDAWLQSYEQEFLVYESLEKFIQVKLPEALAFCDKIEQQSYSATKGGGLGYSVPTEKPGAQQLPSSRFHIRLRIAVYAHLVERTVFALTEAASLSHAKKTLFQARQEIFRAMFADYDKRLSSEDTVSDSEGIAEETQNGAASRRRRRRPSKSQPGKHDDRSSGLTTTEDGDSNDSGSERDGSDDSDGCNANKFRTKTSRHTSSSLYGPTSAPRTLAFFLTKVPFALKLREDTQRRALRFKRNQVVLRRIVQSLYRSLGSVFHAWKLLVRHKKEERLNNKGAQLTAMVVQQRGLVRSVFVEWSKATLRSKIKEMKSNELEMKQQHEQVLADLHREIFLLREKNYELQLELAENRQYRPVSRKPKSGITVEVSTVSAAQPE